MLIPARANSLRFISHLLASWSRRACRRVLVLRSRSLLRIERGVNQAARVALPPKRDTVACRRHLLDVCCGRCLDELVDGRDLCPVGHLQVRERLVLVNALEATDPVPRDRDRVAADQRPIRGVPYTDVRVLPGDHNLVDPTLLQPFVEPSEVERPVYTLRRDDLALARCQLRDHLSFAGAGHRMLSPYPQLR